MDKTIKDVAKRANVSIATVSRYINNPQIVSSKSREKIIKAIKELDYVPNMVAKGLRTSRTHIVGLIVPDINNVYYSAVIQRAESLLEEKGYISLLCTTQNSIKREKKYITMLLEQQVAGIIFIGSRQLDIQNSQHMIDVAKKTPVVVINENSIAGDFTCIGNDEVAGSYTAVQYLHKLGHQRIAFLTSTEPYRTYQRKQQGYIKYLEEHDLALQKEYMIESRGEYEEAGYESMNKLLALQERPTAIHTVNDQMAIGALWALNEAGYKVPGDFSIVGFSNIDTVKRIFPGITTMDQEGRQLGEMAASNLMEMIKGEHNKFKNILIQPKLVERNSCAKVKGGGER